MKKYVLDQKSDINYSLAGALIHNGTADSGHYFSLIKIHNKWFEFNDTNVKQISDSEFEEKSYGGNEIIDKSNGYRNSSSALMLFYLNNEKITNEEKYNICDLVDEKLNDKIEESNQQFIRTQCLFSRPTFDFMIKVNDVEVFIKFFFNVFCHSKINENDCVQVQTKLNSFIESIHDKKFIINYVNSEFVYIEDIFINCSSKSINDLLKMFFKKLLNNVEKDSSIQFVNKLINIIDNRLIKSYQQIPNITEILLNYLITNPIVHDELKLTFVEKLTKFIIEIYESEISKYIMQNINLNNVFAMLTILIDSCETKCESIIKYVSSILLSQFHVKSFYSFIKKMYISKIINTKTLLSICKQNEEYCYDIYYESIIESIQNPDDTKSFLELIENNLCEHLLNKLISYVKENNKSIIVMILKNIQQIIKNMLICENFKYRNLSESLICCLLKQIESIDDSYKQSLKDIYELFLKYLIEFAETDGFQDKFLVGSPEDKNSYVLLPFLRIFENLLTHSDLSDDENSFIVIMVFYTESDFNVDINYYTIECIQIIEKYSQNICKETLFSIFIDKVLSLETNVIKKGYYIYLDALYPFLENLSKNEIQQIYKNSGNFSKYDFQNIIEALLNYSYKYVNDVIIRKFFVIFISDYDSISKILLPFYDRLFEKRLKKCGDLLYDYYMKYQSSFPQSVDDRIFKTCAKNLNNLKTENYDLSEQEFKANLKFIVTFVSKNDENLDCFNEKSLKKLFYLSFICSNVDKLSNYLEKLILTIDNYYGDKILCTYLDDILKGYKATKGFNKTNNLSSITNLMIYGCFLISNENKIAKYLTQSLKLFEYNDTVTIFQYSIKKLKDEKERNLWGIKTLMNIFKNIDTTNSISNKFIRKTLKFCTDGKCVIDLLKNVLNEKDIETGIFIEYFIKYQSETIKKYQSFLTTSEKEKLSKYYHT